MLKLKKDFENEFISSIIPDGIIWLGITKHSNDNSFVRVDNKDLTAYNSLMLQNISITDQTESVLVNVQHLVSDYTPGHWDTKSSNIFANVVCSIKSKLRFLF